MLPVLLIGAGPSFGCFFFLYEPVKVACGQSGSSTLAVAVASLLCAIPSTFVIVPSDVIKKQLVLGIDSSVQSAVVRITKEHGYAGLFRGWGANLAMNLPFALIKMGFYEGSVTAYKVVAGKDHLTSMESGGAGFVSGAATGLLTCPIDVVNTQMKSGALSSNGLVAAHFQLVRNKGIGALFQGLLPRVVLLGCGSSVFFGIYNAVGNALTTSAMI
jgi:hypothetical protein